MPPKGHSGRKQKGQKMGSTSEPGPNIDAGSVVHSFSVLSSSTTQELPAHQAQLGGCLECKNTGTVEEPSGTECS